MSEYKLVPVEMALPCPFCGSLNIGNEYIETYSTDSSYDIYGCQDCGANFNNDDQTGPALWNQRVAAPDAQVEQKPAPEIALLEAFDAGQRAAQAEAAVLVEALVRCQHQASYFFGDSEVLADQLAKVREIVNEALATHRKQGGRP